MKTSDAKFCFGLILVVLLAITTTTEGGRLIVFELSDKQLMLCPLFISLLERFVYSELCIAIRYYQPLLSFWSRERIESSRGCNGW